MTAPHKALNSLRRGNLAARRPALLLASLILAILFLLYKAVTMASQASSSSQKLVKEDPVPKRTAKSCKLAIGYCNTVDLPNDEICWLLKAALGSNFNGGAGAGGDSLLHGGGSGGANVANIPKIIHQSWKTKSIPKTFTAWYVGK
jgi:hypothetical protein